MCGYVGIMEKNMETTIMGYLGVIEGLYWSYLGITEKKLILLFRV